MLLPTNVSTGRVTGQFLAGVVDGVDGDQDPDAVPAQGFVTFTASVPYLPDPTASPNPATILTTSIVAVLDNNGYLCTPVEGTLEPSYRGVRLIATDDPDLSVEGWTWNATYSFSTVNGQKLAIPTHSFAVPSGGEVDLTTVVKVPSSTGIGTEQAEALAASAQAAAISAAQAAAEAAQAALDVAGAAQATDAGISALVGNPSSATAASVTNLVTDAAAGKLDIDDAINTYQSQSALDVAAAVKVGSAGTALNTAVKNVADSQVQASVPSAVSTYIASDPSVVSNAAALVASGNAGLALRADPGMPVAAPISDDYAEMVLDPAGRISEGTFNDGTKHLPHARVDTLSVGTEGTTAPVAPIGYAYVEADASGRIAFGVQDDGTVYAPNLAVENIVIGGVPSPRVTYVVPILGQSNALWKWNDATTVKVRDINPRVKVWNAGTGTADVVPVTHGESLGLAFVMEFARLNPNAIVVAVPTALGSSGFTPNINGTWDYASAATPNLYANALTQTKAALAATGGTLLAMLWSQGENDRASMTEAQYDAAFDAMVAKYRTDVGVSDLPVIVGSMTPEEIANVAGSAPIAAAHVDTPRRVTRTAYVGGPKDYGLYGEQIHYSPQGNAVRGRIFATEGLYRARLNVTGKNPIAPNSLIIDRSGTTATIAWAAPPCRFTAFNLETSTDYGVTWAAQTLTGPVALTHSLTGLTATAPLWARISTTNETGTSAKTLEVKA